jgi:hypothetical protein
MRRVSSGGAWLRWVMVGGALAAAGCMGESSDESGDEDGPNGPNGPNGPSGYCAQLIPKLNGCGLGPLLEDPEDCQDLRSEEDRCFGACILNASCADLRTLGCIGDLTPQLDVCVTGCEPQPFTCGSGEVLPADYRCDSYPDCADGSDEGAGCPTCDSGAPLPSYSLCDGYQDCADGADERGCPTFTCRNGETVPESAECDFFADCGDGSDEHDGCANVFMCADGYVIPDEYECDGFPDCLDGSDEHAGCPSVTCSDGSIAPGARCDGSSDCFDGSDEPLDCPPTPRDQICGTQ